MSLRRRRVSSHVRAATAGALAVASMVWAGGARAEYLNWSLPPSSFDSGVTPRIAAGTTTGSIDASWAVEVHQGGSGVTPLWTSISTLIYPSFNQRVPAFQSGHAFDNGYAPAVAALDATHVIEVHQGQVGAGALWASIGTVNSATPSVSFAGASHYDNGDAPAIAAYADQFLEVHQGTAFAGPLWFHAGTLSGGWNASGWEFTRGEGANPSIAIGNDPKYGTFVFLAYQEYWGEYGPLMFVMGKLQSNGTVTWVGEPVQYDTGYAPSLTVAGTRLIEVHQGQAAAGPLWYHSGEIFYLGSQVYWDAQAFQYDSGFAPSVAWQPAINEGIEIHQGASGPAPIWEHGVRTDAVVPFLRQVNGDWCWIAAADMTIAASIGDGYQDSAQASQLECDSANLRQEKSTGWNDGQFIDCCANISASVCNHSGSVESVLQDNGCSYIDTTSLSFGDLADQGFAGTAVPFGVTFNPPCNSAIQLCGHAEVATGTQVDNFGNQWVVVNDPATEPYAVTYQQWSSGAIQNYTMNSQTTFTSCP